MSEIELRDAILRHALQLQRLSAGDAREVEAILRELERDLKVLLQSEALSRADKAAIRSLISEAEDIINPAYVRLAGTVDTHGLAVIVAEKTAEVMSQGGIAALAPSAERLASLTKNVLIEGSPLSKWWKAQAVNLATRFAAQVRMGVLAGETNDKIVRRLVGGRGEVGLMPVARRHARTLVHSSIMSAANNARLATFRRNSRLIAGVRWLATLDSNTCKRCAALDGQAWDLEGKPRKDTTVSFILPPAHAACRCVASPIPKSFRDLGLKADEPGEGTRASSEGPVPASTTFAEFLKRQPRPFVEDVLGVKRAKMWESGKITLRDLVSGTGRELTLDEIRAGI